MVSALGRAEWTQYSQTPEDLWSHALDPFISELGQPLLLLLGYSLMIFSGNVLGVVCVT